MIKAKKSLLFMISVAVVAVTLVLVGFLLFRAAGRLSSAEKRLKQRKAELASIYLKGNPFPSSENVQRENANVAELGERFEALIGSAREGQIRMSKQLSPTAFMGLLGKNRNLLAAHAEDLQIILPADFNFGFDRYFASSDLPAAEHVPRLLQQLVIVQTLCQILYKEGVAEINALVRQEFEGGARSPGRRLSQAVDVANAGIMEEGQLYSRFRFTIEFRAREQALLNILNRLASHKLFIVVTRLEFGHQGDAVRLPAPQIALQDEGGDGTVDADAVPVVVDPRDIVRDLRMVSGLPFEKPLRIALVLDVYRFRENEEVSP